MRKNQSGHRQFPWEAITADRCSPELRSVVAKVARSEAKSHLQALTEQLQEDERLRDFVRAELWRYGAGYFPLDNETYIELMRVLDRLRYLHHKHEQRENA
jgi:hypothetical protein